MFDKMTEYEMYVATQFEHLNRMELDEAIGEAKNDGKI